jgi:hypothetical protein
MNETTLLHRIMRALSDAGARIFRNHVGLGWQGHAERFTSKQHVCVYPGDVLIRAARPLRAGLTVGSSDLIGWTPREITADMIGRGVAVFTAVEVKTDQGELTAEQARFLRAVEQAGGIAIEARDIEQTKRALTTGDGIMDTKKKSSGRTGSRASAATIE